MYHFLNNQSLLAVETRGGQEENSHLGWLLVTNAQQDIVYTTPGGEAIQTFFRSSAKPFQALPLVSSGLYSNLSQPELAITLSSHIGSPVHIELVRAVLRKAGLGESALRCGPVYPLDESSSITLKYMKLGPSPLYNNCSGKHAGMLYYCRSHTLDIERYLEPEHPLQRIILEGIVRLCRNRHSPDIMPEVAVDGCGAPIFYMPLKSMADLYVQLLVNDELLPLREAMQAYPEFIGGKGRVDTELMRITAGRCIAKVGADGVMVVANTEKKQAMALKVADGSQLIRNSIIVEALYRFGWISEVEYQAPELQVHRAYYRKNTQGKSVGELQIRLPGI